jgi:hypothetical protein
VPAQQRGAERDVGPRNSAALIVYPIRERARQAHGRSVGADGRWRCRRGAVVYVRAVGDEVVSRKLVPRGYDLTGEPARESGDAPGGVGRRGDEQGARKAGRLE